MKFGTKITLMGILFVAFTVATLLVVITWQTSQYNADAQKSVDEMTDLTLSSLTQGIYNLLEAQNESVQQQVDSGLRVALYTLQKNGQVSLDQETIEWTAVNQLDQTSQKVRLPKMLVGDIWLGNNSEFSATTPIVDEITGLVGGTATIFQKMNPAGDMLRVATTVQTLSGQRAIGTYIPAINPDGTPNPVIAAILRGETYHGIAYVVNAWYVTAYEPMLDASGSLIGMMYVGSKQESIQSLRDAIQQTKVGKTGYFYILSAKGDMRGHYVISPDSQQDGVNVWENVDSEGQYYIQSIVGKALTLYKSQIIKDRYLWNDPDSNAARWKSVQIAYYRPWDWIIVSEVFEDEIQEYHNLLQDWRMQVIYTTGAIGLIYMIVVGGIAFWISRSISHPLDYLSKTAKQIANGDLNLVAQVNQTDEIGELAYAFNAMTDRLRSLIRDLEKNALDEKNIIQKYVECMSRVVDQDLSARIQLDSNSNADRPLIRLGGQLNDMIDSLQAMIQQIQGASVDLSSASTEILAATTQQAAGASEQSAAISQTTTTVDEVKTITEQASMRIQEVASAAQRTVETAQNGQRALEETIESMAMIKERVEGIAENILALSDQTQQIGDIIATVNEIAAQSNMLALNASVEAARAGEHGKGFAVVAMEVRNLAEQSRQATAQVKAILSEIQKATNSTVMATEEGTKGVERGVQLSVQARDALEQLTAVINESAQIATQVVAGGHQQQTGVEQIALAMQNINQATVQSLASTRQAEKSAQNLNDLAYKLTEFVKMYRYR
jgi:methyl-accepting chemotaxis protein